MQKLGNLPIVIECAPCRQSAVLRHLWCTSGGGLKDFASYRAAAASLPACQNHRKAAPKSAIPERHFQGSRGTLFVPERKLRLLPAPPVSQPCSGGKRVQHQSSKETL
jgi:hypothetical protein